MIIDTIINEAFKSNTYIISAPNNNEVIIVDPAGDNDETLTFLRSRKYEPRYIILTHEHFDHITGTNSLKENFPTCDILCSKACSERIIDAKLNLSYYRNNPYISVNADVVIEGNGTLNWLYPINCFTWEGHSPGGMLCCINKALFCGDQFIKGIKTVTNLPGSRKEKVKECFDFLISTFPLEMIVYPGHGANILLKELEIY